MLWYTLILAAVVGILTFIFTRDPKKALQIGWYTLLIGVILALFIVYSGLLGG
jgi:uncharacterized membrane protein